MVDGLEEVRPGDVISSALMNRIVSTLIDLDNKLRAIEGSVAGPGKVVVPNLFGLSLAAAQTEITKPQLGLRVGDVFTTAGSRVPPEDVPALERSVLNQVPEGGRIVAVGSRVGLVIGQPATTGGSGPGTGTVPNHQVRSVLPVEGKAADGEVTIVGTGFAAPISRNTVVFDGLFTKKPKEGSSGINLIVDIPADIPNLPRDVQVAVEIDGITRVMPTLYHVFPKSSVPELKITDWLPHIRVRTNQELTITGTGFSPTPSENKVTFILASNSSLTQVVIPTEVAQVGAERRLTLTVPEFSNPLMRPPAPGGTQYNVTVHIGDDVSKVARGMGLEIRPPLT